MAITLTDTDCPICDNQPAMIDDEPNPVPSSTGYVVVANTDEFGEYHTLRKCYNCNHRERPRTHWR